MVRGIRLAELAVARLDAGPELAVQLRLHPLEIGVAQFVRESQRIHAYRSISHLVEMLAMMALLAGQENELNIRSRRTLDGGAFSVEPTHVVDWRGDVSIPKVSPDEVADIRETLRFNLGELFTSVARPNGAEWSVSYCFRVGARRGVVVSVARGQAGDGFVRMARYLQVAPDAWKDAFQIGISTLLMHFGHLVKKCEPCGSLFVRTRRQEYCSTSCSQIVRSQRWYEANREAVLARRHAGYVAEQRKKLRAPNEKVKRRRQRTG